MISDILTLVIDTLSAGFEWFDQLLDATGAFPIFCVVVIALMVVTYIVMPFFGSGVSSSGSSDKVKSRDRANHD